MVAGAKWCAQDWTNTCQASMKNVVPVAAAIPAPNSLSARLPVRFRTHPATACWVLLALFLAGPAGAALLEYEEYVQRANASKRRGDWQSAASQFALAINHPDLPRGGPERSAAHLEYGRAVGALCQFAEAEKYLLQAREIADAARSSSFAALYELGAISVAQKKFDNAVGYFSQVVPMIEREARARTSPRMVADLYEQFAVALTEDGKADEAQSRRREALELRKSSAQGSAADVIAPYGARCAKP